jgi:hypothetical protein
MIIRIVLSTFYLYFSDDPGRDPFGSQRDPCWEKAPKIPAPIGKLQPHHRCGNFTIGINC